MGRGGMRKRNPNFVVLPIHNEISIASLASQNLNKIADLISGLNEDLHIISVDLTYTTYDMSANIGPIEVGLCHDDYSSAEIGEFLEASIRSPENMIEIERGNRLIRRIGMFDGLAGSEKIGHGQGTPIRTKLNWYVGTSGLGLWVKNHDQASSLGGSSRMLINGNLYGRWKK